MYKPGKAPRRKCHPVTKRREAVGNGVYYKVRIFNFEVLIYGHIFTYCVNSKMLNNDCLGDHLLSRPRTHREQLSYTYKHIGGIGISTSSEGRAGSESLTQEGQSCPTGGEGNLVRGSKI